MITIREYMLNSEEIDEIIGRYKNSSVFAFNIDDFTYELEDYLRKTHSELKNQRIQIMPNGSNGYEEIRRRLKKVFKEYTIKDRLVYSKYSKKAVLKWYNEPVYGTAENPNL